MKKVLKSLGYITLILSILYIVLLVNNSIVYAGTLVDETINAKNLYSEYPLNNYQLDFYIDDSWDWLPWNWGDGINNAVFFALYSITNFIWILSLYISYATGYVIQEAFNLDFISSTANSIGKNIQSIAGINENGFMETGFYVGFLLIIILFLGIYVTYTGLLKREVTKAFKALTSFFVIFIISGSFIAYAPKYIELINDFSKDVSNASLSIGTSIIVNDDSTADSSSVDLIRDSLFSIQVKQPWLLLQFGDSTEDEIGTDRVESILSVSPDDEKGKTREEAVIEEIEDNDNTNLTIVKVISRLGQVFFILIINIVISIFVFLLTGIMIFSQIMFIVYASFLPISFLLSMIPTFENVATKSITKFFNIIMARAGITLIITIAFSVSTLLYSIAKDTSFVLVGFLQIITFAGIYFKLGDLMSMFSLQSRDGQNITNRIIRRPLMYMNRKVRVAKRKRTLPILKNRLSSSKNNQSNNVSKSNNTSNNANENSSTNFKSNTSVSNKSSKNDNKRTNNNYRKPERRNNDSKVENKNKVSNKFQRENVMLKNKGKRKDKVNENNK